MLLCHSGNRTGVVEIFAIITVEVLDRHSVIERGVMENNILNL